MKEENMDDTILEIRNKRQRVGSDSSSSYGENS